jgi:fructose-1,6-bisphosphatase I
VSSKGIITIERHIIEAERQFPEATGAFSSILYDIAFAAKMIGQEVRRAGLADILGYTGEVNVQGEEVRKLDEYANEVLFKALDHTGHLCGMASEEVEDFIPIPDRFPTGHYCVLFDPLDGSSNIDVNASVGTIFSIHRKRTPGNDGTVEDCLQKGSQQIAAGYAVYGSSTMFVYTAGRGVHGFTLDPSLGEFLLSHENIRIPKRGKSYSVNEGNAKSWDEGTRRYVRYLKESDKTTSRPYGLRYIGTLVADFHRILLRGGIFLYPSDCSDPAKPKPKLRLLYEVSPMAMIVEQSGGAATTGHERILDVQPTEIHQRIAVALGSAEDVREYQEFAQGRRS